MNLATMTKIFGVSIGTSDTTGTGTTAFSSTATMGGPIDFGTNDLDGVMFIGVPYQVTAAGVLQLKAMFGDSSSSMTASTQVAGSTSTVASTGVLGSSGMLPIVLDVYRPPHRWVAVTVNRATQASNIAVIAIGYKSNKYPIAQTSSGSTTYTAQLVQVTT